MGIKDKLRLNIRKEDRLAEYDGPDKVVSSKEYQEKLKTQVTRKGYLTSIGRLDQYTNGFETGELTVISGYTGHGKTSFCQTLTSYFADAEIKALWFSFEMTGQQFFAKFPKVPLFYLPLELKGKAMDWIEDRILEGKIKYDIRVVFIDHLHFVIDLATSHPSIQIGQVMRSLKTMALKHNISVFLVAHTSMPRGDKTPDLGDIRDSSFITQEADATFVIQRRKVKGTPFYGAESRLTILKHRRMGTMGKFIDLVYQDQLFKEAIQNENQ